MLEATAVNLVAAAQTLANGNKKVMVSKRQALIHFGQLAVKQLGAQAAHLHV